MKFVLSAIVLVALAIFAFLAFHSGSFDETAPPAGASAPKKDFAAIITQLQGDMTKIPPTLDGPRQVPAHAFEIKARLQGATQLHQEYQTLEQVCDLIIYADMERSVRQREYGITKGEFYTSPLDQASDSVIDANRTAAAQSALTRQQSLWDEYRKKTDAEVKRLLATLAGKSL